MCESRSLCPPGIVAVGMQRKCNLMIDCTLVSDRVTVLCLPVQRMFDRTPNIRSLLSMTLEWSLVEPWRFVLCQILVSNVMGYARILVG